MTLWTKKERFHTILSGKKADRPIVIGWRHFTDVEKEPIQSAEVQVEFTKNYDFDVVKFTPRATYYSEVWGNTYDYSDYEGVVPRLIKPIIQRTEDLLKIDQRDASAAPFAGQIEAVRRIAELEKERPIVQTVFSPLSVLFFLAGHLPFANGSLYGSENPISVKELMQAEGVHDALKNIALSIADYVFELGRAGVDGIFYSTMGTAHPELFSQEEFEQFSTPYDELVLAANKEKKTIVHTCGANARPELFLHDYINGLSWDTQATGNPDLSAPFNTVKVCGVNQNLFATNDLNEIKRQALSALTLMKEEPFILAPNCSIPNNATDEALKVFRESVDGQKSLGGKK